jgi:signal transduction histidine kinase
VPSGRQVNSDVVLLGRVVRNLLTNAIKYTESGGILVGCRRVGAATRIEVWDTGCGIPADKLDSVFDDFVQLDNPERDRRKGLGLGLAIVARTCRLLGCRYGVRSVEGKGSMFWVEIG